MLGAEIFTDTFVMGLCTRALYLILILSSPMLIGALGIGLVVSILQATTQVQEQTLGFAIKLIAVVITLVATAPWLGSQLTQYTLQILEQFPVLTK